ncbi:ribonuclease H-like domain-containing protein [Triangularia verruculosa]|uniref:Ribonuclease H-like domain-containing protein n=1 Tax=Triangularia verruculosa TaxID=2587418 RepID=A0AAN6XBS7_9PEZI|nr:ribonuclease H-like domain-containing protein [Triangularia verruculosa]
MGSPPASSTRSPKVSLIDSVPALQQFLKTITPCSSLYLDLEGTNLGRYDGTLDIMTVLVPPHQEVRLLDIKTLGKKALAISPPEDTTKTLKSILEDPTTVKYIWSARNDAAALNWLFNVEMRGVLDIQLLETLTRSNDNGNNNKRRDISLDTAVERDLQLNAQEQARWHKLKKKFHGRMTWARGLFSSRPLDARTIRYCAGDVRYLPLLQKVYEERPVYNAQFLETLRMASAARVLQACGRGERKRTRPTASQRRSFGTLTQISPRGEAFAFPRAGGQTAYRGLGSTLVPKLVFLARRVIP